MTGAVNINPENFASDLLKGVDNVIGTFVQTGYQNLVSNNRDVITLALILYVAWMGYQYLSRTLEMDVMNLAKHIALLSAVYGVLMRWDLFYLFFYNVFTNEPALLGKALIQSGNGWHGESTLGALDAIFWKGMHLSQTLFSGGNVYHLQNYFFALVIFMATGLECLGALFLLMYAKIAMALLLVLAPLFLMFLLWDTLRNFFNQWLGQLFNYAFIPLVTCGILMITLSLAEATQPGEVVGDKWFVGLMVYLCVSFITAFLFWQVLPLCAALSNGLALEGFESAKSMIGGRRRLQKNKEQTSPKKRQVASQETSKSKGSA